jgi:hypothetical protein
MEDAGEELALRQVAGRPEEDDHVIVGDRRCGSDRRRLCQLDAHASRLTDAVNGAARRSVYTAMRALDFVAIRAAQGVLLLVGAIALLTGLPSIASAGQYEVVEACKRAGAALRIEDEPARTNPPAIQGFLVDNRCEATGDGSIALTGESDFLSGGKRWAIAAPADTTIRHFRYERSFQRRPWEPEFTWELRAVGAGLLERVTPDSLPPDGVASHLVQGRATSIAGALFCNLEILCVGFTGTTVRVEAKKFALTLEDQLPPTFTGPLGGSLFSEKGRGIRSVSYTAADKGSGIEAAVLVVDEDNQGEVPDPNGGRCVRPFVDLVPCRLAVNSSLQLDTRELEDGVHEVQVEMVDASGNRTFSPPVPFVVANPPPSDPPPPEVSRDQTPPVLGGVRLSRKAFRAGRSGTVLRFSGSEAGRLSVAIRPARKGAKAVAVIRRAVRAGRGSVPFGGRSRGRPLRPGRYELAVTLTDAAGNGSQSVRLRFRVLAG